MISRREFLRSGGLLAAAMAMPSAAPVLQPSPAEEELREVVPRSSVSAASLTAFVDPLPLPPIARPAGRRADPFQPAVQIPYYRIELREFLARVHRDLRPTRLWGYGGVLPGPTFEARAGAPMLVEWVNALPTAHLLPIDHHIHGAEADNPNVRAVVHLHGARVHPDSDGYPEDWYVPGKSLVAYYPNAQDAAMLWYHDHALGITRLNVYAGLFGAYFIRDDAEAAFALPYGKYEVPLILCDRRIDALGQLYYPAAPMFHAPWLPEFYGNVILANGKILPYFEVEPRAYRLRIVNTSNARFLTLSLSEPMRFVQIGSDQGLLRGPQTVETIVLAPAERADAIVDFASSGGAPVVLNDTSGPVMQFRINGAAARAIAIVPATLRHIEPIRPSSAVRTRTLTLDQYADRSGKVMMMLLNGTHWDAPISEQPVLGSVEIWRFVNLTPDAHPMHLHLVRFQILDRREFDLERYQKSKELHFIGPAIPPEPVEAGWKDTVRCPPRTVTRIIARFEGFTGRYVWHCHILEHEDNEMMRPFEVVAKSRR